MIGRGESLSAALDSALSSTAPATARPDRIQIDILDGAPTPLEKPEAASRSDEGAPLAVARWITPGAEGIRFENNGRELYLLPSQLIYLSIIAEDAHKQSVEELLNRAAAHLALAQGAWRSPRVKLSRLRTVSFVEDDTYEAALRLAGCSVPVTDLDKSRLLAAARQAGDYLIRVQRADGSFHYWYDPLADRLGSNSYNIVRHAGTAYSLLELFSVTRDTRYRDAASRAVRYLKKRFHPAKQRGAVYVLDNDGKAKLGAAGLALLALARQIELDPQAGDRDSARRLASFILNMQRKDGSFDSYYPLRGDEPRGSVSLYYPGEAILGLVSLFKISGDRRLIDAARRGAEHLIRSQQNMSRLPADAWLMQALEALYSIGRERRYAEHAIRLAEAIMQSQYTDAEPAGYLGGFGPGPPRATPAASRAEGLVAAYRIARAAGDPRASKIADALGASARFQLSQQFDSDNSFFLPNPGRAMGGFRAGVTSMRIRIDYVQHNISSLLGVAQALY